MASASDRNSPDILPDRLKILCLHGYRQNADIFKGKLGAFRKMIKRVADLHFVTAPNPALPLPGQENDKKSADLRRWWSNNFNDVGFEATRRSAEAVGFGNSVKYVEKVWNEEGPFDGLLGFSQGACMVHLLCSLSDKAFINVEPKFVVIASGFVSNALVHKHYYENNVSIPSLHIYGESDEIIPPEMSQALISKFDKPQILTHPGKHYFPASGKEKQTYTYFFEDQLIAILEERELAKAGIQYGKVDMCSIDDSGVVKVMQTTKPIESDDDDEKGGDVDDSMMTDD